jgi:biofilm PGA synthesis N-glycosyltransferase PgaC
MLFYIVFICLFLYSAVLAWLAVGFIRTPTFRAEEKFLQLSVTIIICARNEEKNISLCLRSILKQDYVKGRMQLILINDASSDNTVQRAESILKESGINYKIISNAQQKGKKQSISYAMQFANNALIVLRDADTFTTSTTWLQEISNFQNKYNTDLIIAPVAIAHNFGILWAMQVIENNILAVLAGGSAFYKLPFLCNGANLAFTRSVFERTQGYASHIDIASGDDVLFLEDVKKIPGAKVGYLKSADAIVHTYPCFSFKQLLNQKIRWASKFRQNKNKLNLLIAVLSFAVNLAWLFLLVYVYFAPEHKWLCLTFIFYKLVFDILLLFLAARFIKSKGLLWFVLPVGCIYPIYAFIVGAASAFIKPTWKE